MFEQFAYRESLRERLTDDNKETRLFYRIAKVPAEFGFDVPKCETNNKYPQFVIEYWTIFGMNYESFTISIRNQTEKGWIDFKFYALNKNDLTNNMRQYEKRLLKAWAAAFSEQEAKA